MYAEFKSYALSTWNNIHNSDQFFNQFKTYIGSINNMNELAYVINVNKASIDDVKNAFKTMLLNPTKKTQIFEVMNVELKETLFKTSIENLQQNVYYSMINDIESDLYEFIKVQ